MVLAQQPALRMCTGEAAPTWAADGNRREAKEAAVMGTAVKQAFQIVDGEILERARAEQGRDGATALVVLRIGDPSNPARNNKEEDAHVPDSHADQLESVRIQTSGIRDARCDPAEAGRGAPVRNCVVLLGIDVALTRRGACR